MDEEMAQAVNTAADAADKYERMHEDGHHCEFADELIAAVRHLEWLLATRLVTRP